MFAIVQVIDSACMVTALVSIAGHVLHGEGSDVSALANVLPIGGLSLARFDVCL